MCLLLKPKQQRQPKANRHNRKRDPAEIKPSLKLHMCLFVNFVPNYESTLPSLRPLSMAMRKILTTFWLACNLLPSKQSGCASGPNKRHIMKSRFSLWKMNINGQPRWGVNGVRDVGTYTVGPHNGYDTRKAAFSALRRLRGEERQAAADTAYFKSHPEGQEVKP